MAGTSRWMCCLGRGLRADVRGPRADSSIRSSEAGDSYSMPLHTAPQLTILPLSHSPKVEDRFALWCTKLRQQDCVCLWSADWSMRDSPLFRDKRWLLCGPYAQHPATGLSETGYSCSCHVQASGCFLILRPERPKYHSPGHRPGYLANQQAKPCKGEVNQPGPSIEAPKYPLQPKSTQCFSTQSGHCRIKPKSATRSSTSSTSVTHVTPSTP